MHPRMWSATALRDWMEWVDEPTHQLSKFNIMLEFQRQSGHPERMVAALESRPAERVLRLVTVS